MPNREAEFALEARKYAGYSIIKLYWDDLFHNGGVRIQEASAMLEKCERGMRDSYNEAFEILRGNVSVDLPEINRTATAEFGAKPRSEKEGSFGWSNLVFLREISKALGSGGWASDCRKLIL